MGRRKLTGKENLWYRLLLCGEGKEYCITRGSRKGNRLVLLWHMLHC